MVLKIHFLVYRFHCNGVDNQDFDDVPVNETTQRDAEDLFLSVQNLKFLGDDQQKKRSRTSFKFKTLMGHNKHRMFVKQIVEDQELSEDDCSSQLTCYYFDDYAKYIINTDRSRPSTGKSSIFFQGITTKSKENKAVQVDAAKTGVSKKTRILEPKLNNSHKHQEIKVNQDEYTSEKDLNIEDTKIAFHKSGKRKSLTISRVPSPETVQVIRVDVVCNYSSSSTMSDYEDNKKQTQTDSDQTIDNKLESFNIRNNRYANKYLLTNTVKTLDENVSGGAKVTLLCKTFRLTDRGKGISKNPTNKVMHK